MAEGHEKLTDLNQIGDWAKNHVKDTFELDLIWAKPQLPHWEGWGLSKYMLMELIAALLCLAIFIPLARRARSGPTVGRFANFIETMLVFLRDKVARPAIGHDADHFLPYLWTAFFFVLFNNLLGMVPFGGAATSSLETTGALALCTFLAIHGSGVLRMGLGGYLKSMVPDVPIYLWPLMFVVEIIGHLAKTFALCVRLYANLFGGHMAVAVLLGFIVLLYNVGSNLFLLVAPSSVMGVILFSLLDLFVAFLQAYIFTFLSAIFIGMAVHPHH
jgi:F-type H+-transporting ATPase subunit a